MFGPKHLVYARYTYKNRRVVLAPEDGNGNPGSPAPGGTSRPEIYNALAAAYNWVISPSLVNELRGGFSIIRRGYGSGITAQQSAEELGLTDLPGPPPPGYATPSIILNGFTGTYPFNTIDINPREATYQILDSLTWTKSKHTFKVWRGFSLLEQSLHERVLRLSDGCVYF